MFVVCAENEEGLGEQGRGGMITNLKLSARMSEGLDSFLSQSQGEP